MARDNYSQIFSLSTGNELEAELINVFGDYFAKKGKVVSKSDFRFATSQEDKVFGTDAFIYDLPCDFTLNFKGKDHMAVLNASISLPQLGAIRFGIRTGNNSGVRFPMPVLVIGIDATIHIPKHYIRKLIDQFIVPRIETIIDVGHKAYWQYCDAHKIELA